ncbi:MAG: ParA family protein [Phycisphaerales bacterium]|nr:ParA family protein [Phycisphaerales bacterium]
MIIAFLNSKGGVGKSTLAVHAATWLATHTPGVVVVDADAQATSAGWLARAAPELRVERCNTAERLRNELPLLAEHCPLVVCDAPATLNAETVLLAALADLVVLPIGPSHVDIEASYRTARLLYQVRLRGGRAGQPDVITVLNRVQPRMRLAQVALQAVRMYGFPVAQQVVNARAAYAEAAGAGTVVSRLGPRGRPAAEELERLWHEVLGPFVPQALVIAQRTCPATDLVMPTPLSAPAQNAHKPALTTRPIPLKSHSP